MGSLGTGGESDGDYSDDDDEDQGSETNGSMTEDYTDLATSQDGHHGDGRDIAVMRQQMEGKTGLDDSKEQSFFSSEADKPLADPRGVPGTHTTSVQFISFSCSFWQKSCQTIGFRFKPRDWFPVWDILDQPL